MTNIENLGNKEIFAKNLSYYMKLNEIDTQKICKDLNIPASTFSDWLNAKKFPRIDKLEMLANYFKIQKSDLIEDKNNKNTPDELEVLFSKNRDILTKDDEDYIRFIIDKRKKEIDEQIERGG